MAWAVLFGPAVHADDAEELITITVTAPGLGRDLMQTPAAVAAIEEEDLRQGRQSLQLDEALGRVPGVVFQNRYNFAQNLRVSIRGFGARAPFGVRGIRLRVDGLPETLPDGQSQVDAIDLESAARVEVIRGPAAAIYGNAAGGVIDVRTADRIGDGHRLELRGQGGGEGFRRLGVRGALEGDAWHAHASAWDMEYDGYRAQSRTEKRLVHARLGLGGEEGRQQTWLVTALDQPLGEDPGGLTREEVEADRRQAAPGALALDAGQRVRQQRIGWVYSDRETLPGEITAHAFHARRDFRQQLPFPGPSLIGFDRDFYGGGIGYTDRAALAAMPLHYTFGIDAARQRDDRRRFLVDGAGAATARVQDAIESGSSAGAYAQGDLGVAPRIDLTLAGRADRTRLAIDDRLTGGDASGSRRYDELSVMGGAGWQWRPAHRVHANVGTAFETPTFTEFYDPARPDQGFDPSIEPQRALNVEAGIKGMFGTRTRYELAAFTIGTRNEIVQVSTDPNRFANAARTRREGVELAVEHLLAPGLTFTGAWTAARYRFRTFTGAPDDPLRGNRLPGLPVHTVFGEIAWRGLGGAFVIADALYLGPRYADNENQVEVAGHAVVNLRAGRQWTTAPATIELFAGINNVAGREYFGNIRVNAAGGRYFEPAPGRNLYAGVSARL